MQKDRKIQHKKILKHIRKRNAEFAADKYLGSGRFRIDFEQEYWFRFSDNSGGILTVVLRITDKWTGNTATFSVNNYDFYIRIFDYANDFIIRCRDGHYGHIPALHYFDYNVTKVVTNDGKELENVSEGIITKRKFEGLIILKVK